MIGFTSAQLNLTTIFNPFTGQPDYVNQGVNNTGGGGTYLPGTDIIIDISNTVSVNRTSLQNFFDTIYVKISEIVGLVGNWSEDKPNYYNKTEVYNKTESDDRFINRDGDTNITGNFYFNNSYIIYDNNSNNFFYDIDGEYHHQNADAETMDEMLANVFITPLTMNTFANSTGSYLNITSEEDYIAFYIGGNGTSNAYRLNYKNKILELIEGTDKNPLLNRIYIRLVGGVPTWTVSITNPETQHAMIARITIGNNATRPYSASLNEDTLQGGFKRTQRRFRKEGVLYEEGFNYTATQTNLTVDTGSLISGWNDVAISELTNTSHGFYYINSTGDYIWCYNFTCFNEYSDGNPFGSNKYFNVIFGIIAYDGKANIMAVIQSSPTVQYTSTILAYSDNDNTLNVYPSQDYERLNFLPIARMILNTNSYNAQLLANGLYAEDYRGGVAGGVSSGGGLAEADPIWTSDKPNYVPYTGATSNLNMGILNVSASWFKGLFNWTTLSSYLSFNGWGLNFNETLLNETIRIESNSSGLIQNYSDILNSSGIIIDYNSSGLIQNWSLIITGGGDSYWNLTGNNLYPENLNYDVGIGTETPSSKLDVNGNITVNNSIKFEDSSVEFWSDGSIMFMAQ